MNTIRSIVQELDLAPHPEGGFYKETYRSQGIVSQKDLGDAYGGARNFSTSIYFLLTSESFSAFHKIEQDEQWHFYLGSPIKLHVIAPDGTYWNQAIGINFAKGEVPQYMVPGNHWFATEVPESASFALAGCTVAPGFNFKDFVMPSRASLTEMFPQHEAIIKRLTRQ